MSELIFRRVLERARLFADQDARLDGRSGREFEALSEPLEPSHTPLRAAICRALLGDKRN